MLTAPLLAVAMSQVTLSSEGTRLDIASQPSPIIKLPPEVLTEVFKLVVLSSEEARSRGVKTLRLVNKHWNNVANATSDLWTRITLTYPLHPDQIPVARKWLEASGSKTIDVRVDFCYPAWSKPGKESWVPSVDSLQGVIEVLRGSEHRWRSISVHSNTWSPIQEFLGAWTTPSLPALESIFFERVGETPIPHTLPRLIEWPPLFGSSGTLVPKLQEVILCGILVDWTPAATSFQNLHKLAISCHSYEAGPTFGQFSAVLAASPRLETLEVCDYYPNRRDSPTETPLVRLPALKHLVFAWSSIGLAYDFLNMLQIPETLETLRLIQVGIRINEWSTYHDDSFLIFDLLSSLASRGSKSKDPLRSWISTLGLKSLSMSSVYSFSSFEMISFLQKAPMIEEICLTEFSQEGLEAVADLAGTQHLRSLKRFDIQWIRSSGYTSEQARLVVARLRGLGLDVNARKCREGGDLSWVPFNKNGCYDLFTNSDVFL